MQICSAKKDKAISRFYLMSVLTVFSLFAVFSPALAQEEGSIDTLRQMGKAFARISAQASPAVVGIKAEKVVSEQRSDMYESPFDPFGDDFFDQFFRRHRFRRRSPRPKPHQTAQGSGFIISPDGYILTNNHLVGDAEKVTVKLGEDREIEAKVVGTDPESDVAVVKIDVNDLSYLELADSDTLEVGEWVLAIGSPFGLSHTVTAGIVSAKSRSNVGLATYEDFIQTDAAINPGNSGGPLLNLDGKVVGINTAIISRTGGNLGIGLAIPINMAKSIYEQLVDSGTVVRGFLGVMIQDLTPELAESFGLKDTKGVLIPDITEDSAADKAGLKKGDVVIEFDGQAVDKAKVLQSRVAMLKPGTRVKMVVLRDGKRRELTVELGERPSQVRASVEEPEVMERLGFAVQELTEDLASRFGYEDQTGVIVSQVEPGSIAELAGIRPGTLIMEVNRQTVKDTGDFDKAVKKAIEDGSVLLLVKNRNYTRFVVLTLPKK